ncbi:MAG TPA: UDP-N-acetylmuramoyl-tripeptide--D-alanyl-D-alanine ligase [Sedimentisphaerales bacterium]|nr:UDP-N-acetylmuramoyl-tripeptide--D-alanyl-D-alanine ligase [Sedimentisphaerales bacterium]
MKEFLIADLAGIIKANPVVFETAIGDTQDARRNFTGVSTDSRTTKEGDCFFAIPGENFDGHDYVPDAFEKGAVCAVVSKDIDEEKSAGKCLLKVDDTIRALGDLAREYRRQAGYKVVAITGSAGKTTTRQIIFHALSRRFAVYQSPKSFNNQIGLPLTLLGAAADDQIVIAELGSNHPGEISYLTRIAEPDIAVVTNVHPAHLEGFGDLQTIIQEKSSISEGLRPDGVLIINGDFDRLVDACRAKGLRFTTFGKSDGCDYRAGNIRPDGPAGRFTIDGTEVYLPLAGPGNIENALAAWAVCSKSGLTIDDFAQAIETLSPFSMRTELLQIGTLTVLSDCYNANPASMRNALEILANIETIGQRRLVFICGDMAELGRHAERLHAELGTSIAQAGVQLLLAVGKFAKIAAEAAQANAEYDLKIKCFKDTVSAYNNLHEFIKDYDIILVKGSRVAKLEMLVEKLNKLFSRSISREAR